MLEWEVRGSPQAQHDSGAVTFVPVRPPIAFHNRVPCTYRRSPLSPLLPHLPNVLGCLFMNGKDFQETQRVIMRMSMGEPVGTVIH
jgi:hypothetical protein